MMKQDIIVALATPVGLSGIAVIRISGSAIAHLIPRLTGKKVQIELDGGILNINWSEDGVWMTGPTMNVFAGTFSEEFLNSL